MHWFIQLSLELRLLLLAILGLVGGSFANYLIYSWAYFPRHISPFAPPHPQHRHVTGAIAFPCGVGLGCNVKSSFMVEAFGFDTADRNRDAAGADRHLLVRNTNGGLLPIGLRNPQSISLFSPWAHTLFAVHVVMFVLMTAATFIDFDEQTIPDIITTPGTWFALVVSMLPWSTWLPTKCFGTASLEWPRPLSMSLAV